MRAWKRKGPPASGAAFLFGLLLATLALSAVLAYQAIDAARSHLQTAESVLQNYAGLAAAELVRRVSNQVGYYGIRDPLLALERTPPDQPLPAPQPTVEGYATPLARTLFRYSPPLALELNGPDQREFFDERLLDHLVWLSKDLRRGSRYKLTIFSATPLKVVVFRVRGDRIEGFSVAAEALLAQIRAAVTRSSLLPPALGGGGVDNSLLSVRVTGPSGAPVFTTERDYYDSRISAQVSFEEGLEELQATVTLKRQAASQLIIGGLPRSRVPLLMGLLALTTGLVAVALVQLRREREFSRRQSDFIAAVSHELRTPLAQIQMFSDTLLLGRVRSRDEERRSLAIISQETQRLANLVENIILFSRSVRQRIKLTVRPVDPLPVIRELKERFEPLAASSQTSIELETTGDKRLIEVDQDALRRVLLNLLDNAVKYGPPGQIVLLGLTSSGGRLQVWVEDQGSGIPENERDVIWRRFERLPRHRNAAVAGTGIGLSVVKELVDAQGGRAWVETGRRGGARFVVEFATIQPDETKSRESDAAGDAASRQRVKPEEA